jgi:hypothetical protein
MNETWKLYKNFFIGQDLIDEYSFANYFHHSSYNKLTHLSSTLFFPVSVSLILSTFISPILGYGFLITFSVIKMILNLKVGIIYLLFWLLIVNFYNSFNIETKLHFYLILFMGPYLLLSHATFERSLPAFRMFEAQILTPVLLMLWVLTFFGIGVDDWNEIEKQTPKWKGCKYERKLC